jgi:hypothetical protein
MTIFNSYVKLPEGILYGSCDLTIIQQAATKAMKEFPHQ